MLKATMRLCSWGSRGRWCEFVVDGVIAVGERNPFPLLVIPKQQSALIFAFTLMSPRRHCPIMHAENQPCTNLHKDIPKFPAKYMTKDFSASLLPEDIDCSQTSIQVASCTVTLRPNLQSMRFSITMSQHLQRLSRLLPHGRLL